MVENKSICLLWEPNSIFMLIIREKLYCIDPQHCRLVSWLQTKNDYFVVSFKIFATPLMNPNSPISKNLSFSYNPQLSTCLFCHLILIFAKPINSYQICNFRKIAICQDATFCHVIWIFGRSLDDFLAYSPFLPKFPFFAPNLPFSYNRRLSKFPSLLPHLRFCKPFDRFLPISPFSSICHSRENRQLPIGLFCSHLIFLPDVWWILNCQICQFRKMSFS